MAPSGFPVTGVDIITGASLAQHTVNLPLVDRQNSAWHQVDGDPSSRSVKGKPAPMVKRPLTRISYRLGLSARFGPPLTAVRVISPPCRGTSGCLGHNRANSQHNPSLGPGGQGPAARDRRGVLLPAAQGRGWKARRATAHQKPAGAGQDPRGYPLGNSLSGRTGGQGRRPLVNRRFQ